MNNHEKIYILFTSPNTYTPQGLIKDFKSWSGGWTPEEIDEHRV